MEAGGLHDIDSNASAAGLPTTPVDDEEVYYEVEKILKKRRHPTKGDMYYVKWKNFPASANTWEPACNFSRALLNIFENNIRTTSSSTSSTSSSATTSSSSPNISKTRRRLSLPSKRRQKQLELQKIIEQRQQLAVFKPLDDTKESVPTPGEEVVYNPKKISVIVTDVTHDDETVTICESEEPIGFFSKMIE